MRTITMIILLLSTTGYGQTSKTRYRFAQSYGGIEAAGLMVLENGSAPDFGSVRLQIGGLHFWQKADFYISFSVFDKPFSRDKSCLYSENVITGARYLPFGLGRKFPEPYIGLQWITPSFRRGAGPQTTNDALGFELGFNWLVGKSLGLEMGIHYRTGSSFNYYVSRNEVNRFHVPSLGVHFGLKKYLDFTAGNESEAFKKFEKQMYDLATSEGSLNDWNLAIGPSASINTQDVPYLKDFPWMNARLGTAILPDIAVGYYLAKPDMAFRIALRPFRLNQSAYGLSMSSRQLHLGLEAFKFLFDYHGFVPFIGLSGGAVHHSVRVQDETFEIGRSDGWNLNYGLVFGWDIRPTRVEWFILRTNLRYMWAQDIQIDSKRAVTNQLEFNFIQFVFYPQRLKQYKQIQSK